MGATASKNKDMASSFEEQEKVLQDSNKTPKSFTLNYLRAITQNFSTELEIGRGGYGVVYKGVSRSGKTIAVKKLFEIILEDQKFQDEVNFLMEIKHQNIVQLIGYCAESSWETKEQPSGKNIWVEIPKRLLCFEYAWNESLRKHISDESSGIEWNMRYEIIKGICSGLHFLHEERRIVHLDMKPENILMDSTMTPKIADFGLSKIFGSQQSRIITKNCAGSRGYMAPEYWEQGLVTAKADIFSLGVIVIEIIIGSRDYPYFQQDSPHSTTTSLQMFTKKVLGKWRNKFVSTPKYESVERYTEQVRQCITIALRCVDPIMEKRPTAKDIIQMLNALDQTIQITYDAVGVVYCIDANQTEPLIVTGHETGYVQIWNYDTQMQKVVGPTKVSTACVTNVKFIARKGWFVAVSCDCLVHVYKYEKEVENVTSFKAHDGSESYWYSLAVHSTKSYVLSGCHTEIKLWDWDQGWNCIQTFEEHSSAIMALKFNPEDTNSFASASEDNTVKVWSLDSPKSKYTLSGHSHVVNFLNFFTRDGQQYLISGSSDKTAKIWDMEKKECVHTLKHESAVFQVVSHPNLPVLITGTKDGDVHAWSSNDFRLKRIHIIRDRGWVMGLVCLLRSGSVAVAHAKGISIIQIRDEEEQGGCSEGSNENSISGTG